jgi:integrase/recombinase XerD
MKKSKALVPINKAPRKRAGSAGLSDWDRIVPMWLHGRPESTQDVYKPVIEEFRKYVHSKPIANITLPDLQDFADTFSDLKPATLERKLCTVRSLLTFSHRTGLIPFDVGRALRTPKVPENLVAKILSEEEIQRIIQAAPNQQSRILIRVLYASGIRASECSNLRWKDVKPRETAGQITVLGKGSKYRSILLPPAVWQALMAYKPEVVHPNAYVFTSRKGGPLDRTTITHMVERAARRAGIDKAVSAHFLRHGHASHAIDHGAPITLVQNTLGHGSIVTTQRYIHAHPDQSSSGYITA